MTSVELISKIWLCYIFFQAIGGNIMTASPISDLNPVLMAIGSKLTLVSNGKQFLNFPCYQYKFYYGGKWNNFHVSFFFLGLDRESSTVCYFQEPQLRILRELSLVIPSFAF